MSSTPNSNIKVLFLQKNSQNYFKWFFPQILFRNKEGKKSSLNSSHVTFNLDQSWTTTCCRWLGAAAAAAEVKFFLSFILEDGSEINQVWSTVASDTIIVWVSPIKKMCFWKICWSWVKSKKSSFDWRNVYKNHLILAA